MDEAEQQKHVEIDRRLTDLLADMQAAGYVAVCIYFRPPSNGTGDNQAVLRGFKDMDADAVKEIVLQAAVACEPRLGDLIRGDTS